MPNIALQQLIPTAYLHWTSILHYLLIMGTLYMLVTSGDKVPLLYIFILGLQAILVASSLYIDRIALVQILVFLIRVAVVAIPTIMAGWSPTENARSAGVVLAILAAPLLALTFLSCTFGLPLADPRIINLGWCAPA
jgi:hypothetical protein